VDRLQSKVIGNESFRSNPTETENERLLILSLGSIIRTVPGRRSLSLQPPSYHGRPGCAGTGSTRQRLPRCRAPIQEQKRLCSKPHFWHALFLRILLSGNAQGHPRPRHPRAGVGFCRASSKAWPAESLGKAIACGRGVRRGIQGQGLCLHGRGAGGRGLYRGSEPSWRPSPPPSLKDPFLVAARRTDPHLAVRAQWVVVGSREAVRAEGGGHEGDPGHRGRRPVQ